VRGGGAVIRKWGDVLGIEDVKREHGGVSTRRAIRADRKKKERESFERNTAPKTKRPA